MRRILTVPFLLGISLLLLTKVLESSQAVVNGPVHDGVEIACDLPKQLHMKNFGAPKDGLGLCVFSSIRNAGLWHNDEAASNLVYKIEYGGGYPQKVDDLMKKFCPNTKYIQYEGSSPEILDEAIKENKMVSVTYGTGERYGMKQISHMVNLVHIDDKYAVILDNNFPGTYEWMDRDEFVKKRWTYPGKQGWAVVLLEPPPPPIPSN